VLRKPKLPVAWHSHGANTSADLRSSLKWVLDSPNKLASHSFKGRHFGQACSVFVTRLRLYDFHKQFFCILCAISSVRLLGRGAGLAYLTITSSYDRNVRTTIGPRKRESTTVRPEEDRGRMLLRVG